MRLAVVHLIVRLQNSMLVTLLNVSGSFMVMILLLGCSNLVLLGVNAAVLLCISTMGMVLMLVLWLLGRWNRLLSCSLRRCS